MGIEHSAVFDHPRGEVFAWHARPGAIHRLTPPWGPVTVAREATSLEDGTAVLSLPGPLEWVAQHEPDGYEAGRRFRDRLTTPVLASLLRWTHTHRFDDEGATRTRVTDRVDSRVPEWMLREMFGYRTRQLAGDLAAHRDYGRAPLTVAVTGSSGLIGTALCAFLSTGGHRVVKLVRGASPSSPDDVRSWDPSDPAPDLLDGIDAVVHLAGRPIGGRFSPAHKAQARDSRVGPTGKLAQLASKAAVEVFVSASAIGYYGPERGDELLTESSERGDGFLADLVADWEADAHRAQSGTTRVVTVRTGIVQSPRGGVMKLQRPLFELGVGGRLGSGRQWTPWIGIDDLLDIYLRAICDPQLSGPVNAVAPGIVRNDEYSKILARVLRRPALFPVPALGPAFLLGREGASELALASQRVIPEKLEGAGHRFRHPDLEHALRHLLGKTSGATS